MVLEFFPLHPLAAVLVSILINIIISVAGIIPSAFLTAANIVYFGFYPGLLVSIAGEAAGAIISFFLYRKGLHKWLSHSEIKSKFLIRLKKTEGLEAFFLVIVLRILPFAPSGLVTLTAAASKMGLVSFAISSTIGKIPSLFIEAVSVNAAMKLSDQWIISLTVLAVAIFFFMVLRRRHK